MSQPAPSPNSPIPQPNQLLNTCGQCRWAKPAPNLGQRFCYGGPPTPVMLGAQETAIRGQVNFRIESLYPVVASIQPACRVFEPAAETMGDPQGSA